MVISQWMAAWLFNCTLKLSQLKCSKSFINRYSFVTKLCLMLSDPMDCSPAGSSFHGILQARILEWVAISSSRGSSWSRNLNHVSCIDRWVLYHWVTWGAPSYDLFNWKTVHPGQDSWGSRLLISWGRLFSVVGRPVYWRVSPSLPSFYPREPGSILPCPWEPNISPDTVRPVPPQGKSTLASATSTPEAAALVFREFPCRVREPRWEGPRWVGGSHGGREGATVQGQDHSQCLPHIQGRCSSGPLVDSRNHGWYQTLCMLCPFLYMHTCDKD